MNPQVRNLLDALPDARATEVVDLLAEQQNAKELRIERITSAGQASAPDFWYDQDQIEWIILLSGTATIEWSDGTRTALSTGDSCTIPAHCRHRVAKTSSPCVWLAVFWGA